MPQYDDEVSALIAGQQRNAATQAKIGFQVGAQSSPDLEAELRRVARETGVPIDTARAYPAEIKAQAAAARVDFDGLAQVAPATARLLADVDAARIVHDDVGSLTGIEQAIQVLKNSGKALASAGPRFGEGAYGVGQAAAELAAPLLDPLAGTILPENPLRRVAAGFADFRANNKAVADGLMPKADGPIESGFYSGLASLGSNLLAIPAALTAGPAAGLGMLTVPVGGQAYGQARDKGVAPLPAAVFGTSQAAIEYATEKIPMSRLLGDLAAKTGAAKMLTRQLAAEIPGEQVATLLQDANEWAVLNPDKTAREFLAERPSAALQTLIATVVGTGGMVAVTSAADKVMQRAARQDDAAQRAEGAATAMQQVQQVAEASKLLQRDGQTLQAFMQSAAEDGAEQVFIDPQQLAAAGVNLDALALAVPSVAAQLQSVQTGGDLVIPTGEMLVGTIGAEYAQALIEHVRTAPDAMSMAEAKTYMTERGDQITAQIAAAMSEQAGNEQFTASRDQVREEFTRQLDEAKRFTSDVNRNYSALLADFYAVTAAKVGVTPAELAQRYPLRIAAQGGAGANTLDQAGSQPKTDTPEFKAWFGDSKVVDANGEPLVVYHGTNDKFTRVNFKKGAQGLFWFASDRADIESGEAGAQGTAHMMELYAKIENPAGWAEYDKFSTDELRGRGYDGVILPEGDGKFTGFIFKDAAQVKSATRNRGTFDPNDTNILNQQARGQIAFGNDITTSPTTLTLLKGADLSTFIHESGHFFLEVQSHLAGEIQARIQAGEDVPAGEREIVADMNTLLAWFGVKETPEQSAIVVWQTMTLEEKRQHHESFARGFEAYAFDGKAPSLPLQSVFQRFRAWLVNVYKTVTALNVEITDEVRGVMDRMIASTQAIEEAEAARAMGPLFNTAEEAGATTDEFKAYHDLGMAATQDAIQELQGRGLRDMRWLQNAKGRKVKELQKLAAGLRRDVEREVRATVMSQPLYRAWQFLTSKAEADQTGQPSGAKVDPAALDVTQDSLLVAIAKLGGLNRDAASRLLGVHKDDYGTPSGVFGKPVFRKDGGRSPDSMLELLAEARYLNTSPEDLGTTRDLEEAIADELFGSPRYSAWKDYSGEMPVEPLPDNVLAGKLNTAALREQYGTQPDAIWRKLSDLRMTSEANGLPPDVVAETFGFSSGDELVRALAAAEPPKAVIEAVTDQRMLERHGELSSPEAIERAADAAIHNEARGRFIATELAALDKAGQVREKVPGQRNTVDVMARAAKDYAAGLIARLKVRDIRPSQYTAAEARAAKAAEKAFRAGDTAEAAAQKRNQLIQHQAARAANDAREEVRRTVDYLRRFESRPKSVAADYLDQIEVLLERFDLRTGTSLKEIDRRKSLAAWVESQREEGKEPDIPDSLLNEAFRQSWRDMTVEELRGLRDTVKQIENLGRLKGRLLTSQAERNFDAARDTIVESINANARGRTADTRTPSTKPGRWLKAARDFGAAHIKAATWARVFDGGQDGGPVWEYLIRPANERGDMETTMRAEATQALHAILDPLLKAGPMGGKGRFFESIGRSMNREQVLAMALNMGNEGNMQRMLDGEGWALQRIQPVLATLNSSDWRAVQAIWDHFESYRDQIGAKERRVYGKEPNWVEPVPLQITAADGVRVELRGGYYPVKYDPLANNRAEQHSDAEDLRRQLQGAYTSATTRRGFTKARSAEVKGRPLLYSLAGVYSGVNDVIHDLAWHEWLIDANKLLSSDKIDNAIRSQYGPAAVQQLKTWVRDVAAGDHAVSSAIDAFVGRLRRGVSVAGLGFNVMSAAMQPLGLTQSIVRVGAKWVGRGIGQYIGNPVKKTREVGAKSEFMANRSRTRFRELNELRNVVEGQTAARAWLNDHAYFLMMQCQQMVDVPTWLGAYEKAISEGNDEDRAISLADQAVIDAQGGGQAKDLSALERGGPLAKSLTVFYSFMNTALNLGVAQTMTAKSRGKLAADYLMIYTVPVVLGALLKDALTPGDGGDEDPEELMKKLLGEQIGFFMGLFVGVREFTDFAKLRSGTAVTARGYGGPAGFRAVGYAQAFAQQAMQGEFDDSFRKAAINLMGSAASLPAAQVNRTITGAQALADGETANPAALAFGYQRP